MYVLLLVDLDISPEFIDIIYSVYVARVFLFADRRNLPFSAGTAVKTNNYNMSNSNIGNKKIKKEVDKQEKHVFLPPFFSMEC